MPAPDNATTGWDLIDGKVAHPHSCSATVACEATGTCDAGPPIWGSHPYTAKTNAVPLYDSRFAQCKSRSILGRCDADIVEQPVNLDRLGGKMRTAAMDFIKQHSHQGGGNRNNRHGLNEEHFKRSPPFFLHYSPVHTHVPHAFSSDFANFSTAGTVYADALREMDSTVGSIMASVVAGGVKEHTMVIFTGVNGPWAEKCDLGGFSGPFQGEHQKLHGHGRGTAKFTTWEGGHRMPTFFYFHGKIGPGESHALASTLDLMPTLSELGACVP